MTDTAERYIGTKAVDERLDFDHGQLADYMRAHVADFAGDITVAQFKGGQSNPTYKVGAGGRHYVLRRKPPGKLAPSAHAVDREYKVISALAATDVPVPKTYALCEDESVIGTAFYLMECLEGRVFWDFDLPGMTKPERAAIYDAMNDVIARLHNVDYDTIDLEGYGRPGNYFARQIGRWSKQYRDAESDRIVEMDRLIDWLPDNIPDGDETTIVHGDYRLDNMIYHPTEPRVLGVLDWELGTLGHPLGDFSYHCMTWRVPGSVFRGLAEFDLAALGIPSEQDYVAAYCRRTGRDGIANWEFYMAYNMFRMAAIAQGILGRVRDGTAANPHAMEMAKAVRPFAEMAWAEAEKVK
jgi:aminoglycoside phosphotransferase (APT) family kinase protein